MNFLIAKMNKPLLTLVIALLLAISFGSIGFTLMDHSNMETCLVSAMSGNDCSSVADKAIFALHHVEAFQQFTEATVSYGMARAAMIPSQNTTMTLARIGMTVRVRYGGICM